MIYAKLLLKIFLSASIPFGLIMYLVFCWSSPRAIQIGILSGVAFGLPTALYAGENHRIKLRNKGFRPEGENLDVVHKRSLCVYSSYEQTFDSCIELLSSLLPSRVIIKSQDRSMGIIIAHSYNDDVTEGGIQRIAIKMQPKTENSTNVAFMSKPLMRFAFIDYGSNLLNVEQIKNYLQSLSSSNQNGEGLC